MSTLILYYFTATFMYIATVAMIIDVSTLGTPEVEWGMLPCRSGPPSCSAVAAAPLGSGRPEILPTGARSANGLDFDADWLGCRPRGFRPGDMPCCCYCYYHYNIITKGYGSPLPLSGVYIEHWCNDIVHFIPVFFLKKIVRPTDFTEL